MTDSEPRGSGTDPVAVVEAPAAEVEKGACVVIDVGGSNWEVEKVCRICHLSPDAGEEDGSELIQLGCGCKGELGTAHRHCAEAWFKVKGSRCCEICGANAKNITGEDDGRFMEEWHEGREMSDTSPSERRGCWRRQLFCNFLMVCLIVAFVLPWFFRFDML